MARTKKYNLDWDTVNPFNKKELEKIVSSMAKAANTRLRRLEESNYTEASNAYKYIERKAFGGHDKAFGMSRKGEIKFRTDVTKMTASQLKHEAALLDNFLNAKTSTREGTANKYLDIANALNDKLGKNRTLSPDAWGDIWRKAKDLMKNAELSSEQIVKMVRRLSIKKASAKQIVAFIEDANNKSLYEIEQELKSLRVSTAANLRHSTDTVYI